MTFLADVNLLSEGMKPRPDRRVMEWLAEHESSLVVDSVVLGEIYLSILLLPVGKRRQQLEQWFQQGIRAIVCLPWESATAMRWAKLVSDMRAAGKSMPLTDSMIAASALAHDLPIATRNARDFRFAGVTIINPFE